MKVENLKNHRDDLLGSENKFENYEGIGNFQEYVIDPNSPERSRKSKQGDFPRTKKVVKELPPSKALFPDSFTGEFY